MVRPNGQVYQEQSKNKKTFLLLQVYKPFFFVLLRILQSSYSIYKQTNNQNLLNSDTGASLDDAIKRYKLYERKLGDNLNNNAFEAALKRFVNHQTDSKTVVDSDNDDISSKPPLSNPSSLGKVSNQSVKKEMFILDGSKKNPYNGHSNGYSGKIESQNEYDLNEIIRFLDDGYYMRFGSF
jgi:hypothetical protein